MSLFIGRYSFPCGDVENLTKFSLPRNYLLLLLGVPPCSPGKREGRRGGWTGMDPALMYFCLSVLDFVIHSPRNSKAEQRLYCYKNFGGPALGNQTPFRFRTSVYRGKCVPNSNSQHTKKPPKMKNQTSQNKNSF